MGRSENSRNRIFEALPDGSGIRTCAADPAKLKDPHLIIYSPVRTWRHTAIITNGDQTDTIYQYMEENNCPGYSFEAALASRTFEDDAPNWTPRISAAADMAEGFLAADAVLNLVLNVTDGLVVYPQVIRSRVNAELPFMVLCSSSIRPLSFSFRELILSVVSSIFA